MNIEVKCRENHSKMIEFNQMYASINDNNDVSVNGAVAVIGNAELFEVLQVYANVCNKDGAILYVLNAYKDFPLKGNDYFSFTASCSGIDRYLDIKDISFVEPYVVLYQKSPR